MRTNVAPTRIPIHTHEGAKAAHIGVVDQLRRSTMACMLFEDTFYEDGVSIAQRIQDEIKAILDRMPEEGPAIVANIAYEARSAMKLRHAPLWLILGLIRANTKASRAVVSGAIAACIQRPDEMAELLAMYWKEQRPGDKKMLTRQMKIGLGMAFRNFNEYSLAKYAKRDGAVSLRDVMFLAHIKPKGGTAHLNKAYRKTHEGWMACHDKFMLDLAAGNINVPEDTWEVQLSAGADKKEAFTGLLREGKLGALALLRNLRNMQQAGVDDALIREGLEKMSVERVLPFRFITAAKYAPQLEPQLETAMFKCLDGMEKLPGKTVLVIDRSGSMDSTVSGKSEISRIDAACALAMLLREICEEVWVIVFSDSAQGVPPRRGFALRDAIKSTMRPGGTNTAYAIGLANTTPYDRIIVITDEQSHQAINGPQAGSKAYFVNVATNQNGIGYGAWHHIDGWSEAIVSYIQAVEKQQ